MKNFKAFDEFITEGYKPKFSSSYYKNLLINFDMYSKIKTINGWTLNSNSLEKDKELVWQKEGYSLYTHLFSDKKELVEFELIDESDIINKIDLKKLIGTSTLNQKYTENYLLDIQNYIKNVEKFTQKLNQKLK